MARNRSISFPDLSVVMPVYNEEETIEDVLSNWIATLNSLSIDYEFRVYNDGSKDGTLSQLENLAKRYPSLMVINKKNEGHGPTILQGYRESPGTWVFQTDGDNEMPSESFKGLWEHRDRFDILLGCRAKRTSPPSRRIVTACSKTLVRIMWGKGIWDVNTPYRLIRRTCLEKMLQSIPPNTFAPNLIISGLAMHNRLRTYQCWVSHHTRNTGKTSLAKWRLCRAALMSFFQTVRIALSHK